MNVGKVLDSDVLLITTHIGSAEGGKGGGYKMSLINANTPAVKSVKTGRLFTSLGMKL